MASLSHKVLGGAWKLLSELREVYDVLKNGEVLKRLRGVRVA